MARSETLTYDRQQRLREYVGQLGDLGSDYKITRAILAVSGEPPAGASLELEISRECARRLEVPARGIYIPTTLQFGQRALSTTAGAGGQTVFTAAGSLIEFLRSALQVAKLGARIITGLVGGPVLFPKQLTAGTLTWVSETPGADVSDTDLTTGSVSLSPKTGQASTAFSRQLLQQASLDVEELVRRDLIAITAVGIDKAAIQGTGTLQPLGILGTAGVGLVEIGDNGGYPTGDHLQALETLIYSANVGVDSIGYLTTPGIRGYFRKTLRLAGSSVPIFVWEENRPDELRGYRGLASNNVPSTLTKGTKSDCHAIILGNWSDLLIGEWGVIDLIVDPYRLKKQGVIEVTSFVMCDVCLRHPEAFAVCKDARIVA